MRWTASSIFGTSSRNVTQTLFVVDPVVGVSGDDPHAPDLPPGNLRRRLDNVVRQLGRDVAQPADDRLPG